MPMYLATELSDGRWRCFYRMQDCSEETIEPDRESAVAYLIEAAKFCNGATITEADITFRSERSGIDRPGWLDRQFQAIREESRTWPAWMKRAADMEGEALGKQAPSPALSPSLRRRFVRRKRTRKLPTPSPSPMHHPSTGHPAIDAAALRLIRDSKGAMGWDEAVETAWVKHLGNNQGA